MMRPLTWDRVISIVEGMNNTDSKYTMLLLSERIKNRYVAPSVVSGNEDGTISLKWGSNQNELSWVANGSAVIWNKTKTKSPVVYESLFEFDEHWLGIAQ